MNTILVKIVQSFEQKLARKLTAAEFEFLKWLVKKHLKG